MDRYSLVLFDDVEKIRSEFAILDRRAKASILWDRYILPFHILLSVIATLIALATYRDAWTGFWVLAAYLIYPGIVVTGIVWAGFSLFFERPIMRYLLKRRLQSDWYARHAFLKAEIDRIDAERKEFEKKEFSSSFRLLEHLRALRDGTTPELRKIESYFRRKKRWYDIYREYEVRLFEIALRSETTTIDIETHRQEFPNLPQQLDASFKALHTTAHQEREWAHRLLDQLEEMKGWVAAPSERLSSRISIASRRGSGRARPNVGVVTPPTGGKISSERLDERAIQIVEQTPPRPPEPLKRIERVTVANISMERYLRMAEAKMSIGDIGERLVLDFERQRVERETGKPAEMVRRVSTESDSYGYDIISIFDGEEVHIEVKTTRGKFDNDFFLTSNERKVMQELGESYWLYRVYELSAELGTAKLSAFRGQSTIEDSFILEPSAFVFRRRRHNH